MKIDLEQYECHLSYCLNVHPGNSWQEHFAAIRSSVPKVRARLLDRKEPFGLGMRLSAQAAETLLAQPQEMQALMDFFRAENLYCFSINVFPYGEFHRGAVKEKVYLPDWETPERLRYTLNTARILAIIMPADLPYGTLNSLPIGYRAALKDEQLPQILAQLSELIRQLEKLERETGRQIRVGLEPEPDCYLDSSESIVEFFCEKLRKHCRLPLELQNRYLGVCLDTCHIAVIGESSAESLRLLRQKQIPVVKIHLSAAPIFKAAQLPAAEAFVDPVYLHQSSVRVSGTESELRRFADLPPALAFAKKYPDCELRTHFHIPLSCPESSAMSSTSKDLDSEFVSQLKLSNVRHLEVETYTFAVLPPHLRQDKLETSIAKDIEQAKKMLDTDTRTHGRTRPNF